ncbi:RNA 2'-phosphotransferase [Thermococcus thioreducens]|uniref:Probable RNA 2'-phosphotransferase n=1 Tax=Thermococcus thioreducens TaxID=277988 RepID=A0A0Q2M4M2_9EURY|nr:RNA 2'-phosphotransferase [Thermococcus thioreducens]ASJ13155.1 RNA 2'-phosphotransferase [Thermococcus thioreducens]KQH82874.1 RNA 2'-phosphotransferase [Thermococcus thioreducens]SEW20221.1 putative RNA 2'-phosphotransferase [Thermococcus thioreducens]
MPSRVKVSRLMAYILRHSPEEFGLKPDVEGFVPIDELIRVLRTVYPGVTEEFVREIVENDPKGLYEIRGNKIRARYGHSFEVKLNHEDDRESRVLYHGTPRRNLERILREGLKPMERQFVHLSTSREDALETGRRHGMDVVILIIDAECLRKRGLMVYKAGRNVRIVKKVPLECIVL